MFELTQEQRQELMEIITELLNLKNKGIISELEFFFGGARINIKFRDKNDEWQSWNFLIFRKTSLKTIQLKIEKWRKNKCFQ